MMMATVKQLLAKVQKSNSKVIFNCSQTLQSSNSKQMKIYRKYAKLL